MPEYRAERRLRLKNSENIKIESLGSFDSFSAAASINQTTHVLSDEHGPWMIWVRDPSATGNKPYDKPGWANCGRA